MKTAPSIVNEKIIWERFRQGDEEATAYLYDRYWETTVRSVEILGAGREQAESVAQEVFFGMLFSRVKLRAPRAGNLFRTAARNLWFQRRRRHSYWRETPLLGSRPLEPQWRGPTPEDHLLAKERLRAAKDPRLIAKLSPKQRAVYKMFLTGHSIGEIAIQLGISRSAVSTHLHEAKKKIRAALGRGPSRRNP